MKLLQGAGVLVAYLGKTGGLEIEKRTGAGNAVTAGVFDAISCQIAKEIGACGCVRPFPSPAAWLIRRG